MSFRNLSYRTAFTLVELLVAMVIAGILSSMVAIALQGAQRQAQDTRAKSLIDRLNITLLQLYEQETYARVALPAGAESTTTRSLSELMWRRDWLRCAFPDRREDIAENPVRVPYPLVPLSTWLFIDDGVPPRPANPTLPVVVPGITSGVTATSRRAQQLLRFRQRIARTIQAAEASKGNAITVTNFTQFVDGSEANGEWTAEHQSAECLYLILSTNMVNGVPASDSLRTRDVGDIDEDGMPEVLDAWGVPVGYMRWPVGLTLTPDWNQPNPDPASTAARPAWAWLHSRKTLLGPDPLDTLSSDPRYFDNSDTSLDNPRAEDPFPLVPL
ncbi:MAG: type II secretion system protein, partial [Planctomycetota bacterium]